MPRREGNLCTDAQIAAVKRYQAKHSEFKLRCLNEERAQILQAVEEYNRRSDKKLSVNRYILQAVFDRIQREAADVPETVQEKTPAQDPEQDMKKLVDDALRAVKKSRKK